jgi:flagellar hook assembly protein FlgD
VDPASPAVFWTYQEYAASAVSNQYTTGWASFTMGSTEVRKSGFKAADRTPFAVSRRADGATVIDYRLDQKEDRCSVGIFDPDGHLIARLFQGMRERGNYRVSWNGTVTHNAPLSSGIYLVEIQYGNRHYSAPVKVVW